MVVDVPLEKLYECFSQLKNGDDIVRSFENLKSRLDKRANKREYLQQIAAKGVRVFIVGAGPIGLRQAIECVLLGTEVSVVEKRSSFAKRNNVLHLWPCTIEDLRQLGAKKFSDYGKFRTGVVDHISKLSLATQIMYCPGHESLNTHDTHSEHWIGVNL